MVREIHGFLEVGLEMIVLLSLLMGMRGAGTSKLKSKADNVAFILDLITKVGAEIPAADMNNVNIIGTSNGAALTYCLMIETGADRPFRR